jgi:hypothetical protein
MSVFFIQERGFKTVEDPKSFEWCIEWLDNYLGKEDEDEAK